MTKKTINLGNVPPNTIKLAIKIDDEANTIVEILSRKLRDEHYVDKEKFYLALKEHKEARLAAAAKGEEEPILTNYIALCFLNIAEGLAKLPKFNQYSYIDEMKGDAVDNCLAYYRNFDPDWTPANAKVVHRDREFSLASMRNPFAYFTKTCYWAFLRRIEREKKMMYAKYKIAAEMGVLFNDELVETDDGRIVPQFELYANIAEYIHEYEAKLAEKKKKKKAPVKTQTEAVESPISTG